VLGLADCLVVKDALSGEILPMQESCVVLSVKSKDFRLLTVSN